MSVLKTVIKGAFGQASPLARNTGAVLGRRRCHDVAGRSQQGDDAGIKEEKSIDQEQKKISYMEKFKPGNGVFPTLDVHDETFDGVGFADLPKAVFKCTRNNTKAYFTSFNKEGDLIRYQRSAGTEGYKNAQKSTEAAAQTVGFMIGRMMFKRKKPNVRVIFQGVSTSSRFPILRGLLLGGVNVVALSDQAFPTFNLRPNHRRRV